MREWKHRKMAHLRMISKTFLIWSLIFQAAVFPVESFAGRKLASVRSAPAGKKSVARRPTLIELRTPLRDAYLHAIGQKYYAYEPEELRELLLLSMPAAEREEMRPLLTRASLEKLVPRRQGDALILEGKETKVTLRWPKFPEPTFNINGVDWTYSEHQSMKFNVELLIMLQSKHGKNARLGRLLLEEARATGPAATLAIAFLGAILGQVVQAGANYIANKYCLAHYKENEEVRVYCADTLEKIAKAKATLKQLSAVQPEVAVKKLTEEKATGAAGERTMWVPDDKVKSCPTGKSQDIYIADVYQARMQKNTMQKVGDWKTVKFELQPGTGKMKKGVIAPVGTDLTSSDLADEAEAIFDFDDNGLKTIYVRNPKRANVEDPPMVPIDMAKDTAALDPGVIAEKNKWVELVGQISSLITSCILAEAKAKVSGPDGKTPPPPPKQNEHPSLPTRSSAEKAPQPDRAPR